MDESRYGMVASEPASVIIQDCMIDPARCELCGTKAYHFLPESRRFGSGQVWVCDGCGFVTVPRNLRRSSAEVAAAWGAVYGEGYTAAWPAVVARMHYVAEIFSKRHGWTGKEHVDIGAGEGAFCSLVREYGGVPFGIEPSQRNNDRLRSIAIRRFQGTIEQFMVEPRMKGLYFDVATILWTLENTADPIGMLKGARSLLSEGGTLIVATGSRILVPYKKPLSTYFSQNAPDLHCSRFSAKSLSRALHLAGFNHVELNDYMQSDWLVAMARVVKHPDTVYMAKDDPQEVLEYFRKWGEAFP